ncbi:hypothetical protein VTK26DRAFT_8048 [Humicola hyalothermophila]
MQTKRLVLREKDGPALVEMALRYKDYAYSRTSVLPFFEASVGSFFSFALAGAAKLFTQYAASDSCPIRKLKCLSEECAGWLARLAEAKEEIVKFGPRLETLLGVDYERVAEYWGLSGVRGQSET